MIKLTVFDLDKTLLDDAGLLPSDFEIFQKKMMQKGIQLAIATTRPLQQVKKIFGNSFASMVGVSDNGNRIFWREYNKILYYYKQSEVMSLVKYVGMDSDIAVVFSSEEHLYIDRISAERFHVHNMEWLIPKARDVVEYINNKDAICGINFICFPQKEMVCAEQLAVQKIDTTFQELSVQYNLLPAGYGWIAVLPTNEGKAHGLKALMEQLHIKPDEMMIFGDSENDVPMFELTKYSFAMKNANQQVKAQATFITTEDNNHNGALKAMFSFMQKGEGEEINE